MSDDEVNDSYDEHRMIVDLDRENDRLRSNVKTLMEVLTQREDEIERLTFIIHSLNEDIEEYEGEMDHLTSSLDDVWQSNQIQRHTIELLKLQKKDLFDRLTQTTNDLQSWEQDSLDQILEEFSGLPRSEDRQFLGRRKRYSWYSLLKRDGF